MLSEVYSINILYSLRNRLHDFWKQFDVLKKFKIVAFCNNLLKSTFFLKANNFPCFLINHPLNMLFSVLLNLMTLFRSLEQSSTTESEADQVYRTNPVLKYSKIPLKAPLLPLPYGQSQSSREFKLTEFSQLPYQSRFTLIVIKLKPVTNVKNSQCVKQNI